MRYESYSNVSTEEIYLTNNDSVEVFAFWDITQWRISVIDISGHNIGRIFKGQET